MNRIVSKARTLTVSIVLAVASVLAQAQAVSDFNVPAQSLAESLRAIGAQTNVNVLYDPPLVAGMKAPALAKKMSTDEALRIVLKGTGLTHRFVNEHTVVLEGATRSGAPRKPEETRPTSSSTSNEPLHMAQTGRQPDSPTVTTPSENLAPSPVSQSASGPLQEVLVTAQKRAERLQDVPVPVTAVSGATLTENNSVRVMDYYTKIPSLVVSPANYSSQLIAIRGITTGSNSGAGTPTTGIMVDEVPFGNSTGNTPGFTVPDFDPGDLARVEVLRGPQGTLYGASSMGGLIKYVTVDPSTAGFASRVEASASSVRNGDELGYTLRGSVNVPLSESFAVRASAFTRQDAGYIDNPALGIDGINHSRANGAHLGGLWRPADGLSIKLSAIYQKIKGDGTSDFTSVENVTGQFNPLGDLQQGYIRGIGPYKREAQAYGAIVTYQLGAAELTSVTGYNVSDVNDSIDYTQALGSLTPDNFGVGGSPIFEQVRNSRFSQELRLAVPLGTKLEGLAGLYYDDERASPQKQQLLASDTVTGEIVDTWLSLSFPSTYSEHAAFADLTYHVTDRFEVQAGARYSRLRIGLGRNTNSGAFNRIVLGEESEGPFIREPLSARNNASTYLLTPRFRLTDDVIVYARLASGYRPGGPNVVPGVPREYDPDKTENYEVGLKGDFLDHRVSIDTSVYFIDWKNIQLSLVDPVTLFGFTGNAGTARSQGVELSVDVRPVPDLRVAAWIAYNDAQLTSWPAAARAACEAGLGPCTFDGARLPLSPRFSGNVSIDRHFQVTGRLRAFVGGDVSYVGGRVGVFAFSGPRQVMPAYARTDLRAGFDLEAWRANLYVNNVLDRRGLVSGGLATDLPYSFYYIQPRTVGVSIAREF